jgi:hypothetical protein
LHNHNERDGDLPVGGWHSRQHELDLHDRAERKFLKGQKATLTKQREILMKH